MRHTLQSKIQRFQQYQGELASYLNISDGELAKPANKEKLHTMERFFQLMVDEAIDINQELIQLKANKIPDTYRSTFTELPAIGIFDQAFADKLASSVKVRNHIVHEYEDMKTADVIHYIKQYAEMYTDYIKEIVSKAL